MPWGRKGDERSWLRAATPAWSQDGLAAGRKKQTSKQVVEITSDVLSSAMCGCESIRLGKNFKMWKMRKNEMTFSGSVLYIYKLY